MKSVKKRGGGDGLHTDAGVSGGVSSGASGGINELKNELGGIWRERPAASQATPQATPRAELTELEDKIVAEIKANPKISRNELAKKIGISPDTVKEYLGKLKSKGAIIRVGRTSAGHWEIIK